MIALYEKEFHSNSNKKDIWLKYYILAKKYFEHHGNLEIPSYFKTINGYEYDEQGIRLGHWIQTQRTVYNNQRKTRLSIIRFELLKEIDMRFGSKPRDINKWNSRYELLKSYYNYHGNLKIPTGFKSINGYEYNKDGERLDTFLSCQKESYKGNNYYKLDFEQIKLLEDIDIKWYTNNLNYKLQKERITDINLERKSTEIQSRVYSLINLFDNTKLPTKEEINKEFIKSLNIKNNHS